MHRTQILLEEWQYDALKAAAERQGKSISELLRSLLTEYLRPPAQGAGGGLSDIRGLGRDARARGRDHDRLLYGPRTRG